jgi:hypothetical protein
MLSKRMLGYATRLLVTTLALTGCPTKPGQIWPDTLVPPIDAPASLGLPDQGVASFDQQPSHRVLQFCRELPVRIWSAA